MAERKRGMKRRSITTSEGIRSSQVGVAPSWAPSGDSLRSDMSMYMPDTFGKEPQRISQVSVAQSWAPSGVSLRSDRSKSTPLTFAKEPQSRPAEEPPQKNLRRDAEDEAGRSNFLRAKENLKKEMRRKFTSALEGLGDRENLLTSIYTTLFITAVESEGPHEERSFRHAKQPQPPEESVKLRDILKPAPGRETPVRVVLTKGVAGIGKSFSVQKYILDWAEGRENQDVDFVFNLAFRELNLSTENRSLHRLLADYHPAVRDLKDPEDLLAAKVVVILDGLDEGRFQLNFRAERVRSVSEATSVGNLVENLVRGDLLPDAKLWITSRPAAANQIPAKFVDVVTEIRGFSDQQKEEYFRKRFGPDEALADRVVSHMRSLQSFDIMCQIPIFCWIAAVLFKEFSGGDEKAETHQTLTEMMAHLLITQTRVTSRKYHQKTHREFLLKLGKLAFVQLQKNNLIFYEEDLEECGIDVQEATVYSGFCTMILREERVAFKKKVFFFVHLIVQEFFAAFFVFDCFTNENTKELGDFLGPEDDERTLLDLLKMTVDKVLEDQNGHLDLFLRFLLGLMVEPNRRVLRGLLNPPDSSQDSEKKILTHLKAIRRKTLSPDSCINLFQNMVEMRDHKVKDEIQEYLGSSDGSQTELSPLHCSALAYMLQASKQDLGVLDLKSYNTSEEGRRRLIPAVRISRKAILADCNVNEAWLKHLAVGLRFPDMPLRHLDLSNNDLKDSGVKLLCEGLSSQCCRLEALRLSGCQITGVGCASLASALGSKASKLMELDLSYNHPGESGRKELSKLTDDPRCKINLDHGGSQRMKAGFRKYACTLTWDPSRAHEKLLLSEGNRKVTWVEDKQPEGSGSCQQVLCQQVLEGRCYWEAEVTEPFNIGLTSRTGGRKEEVSACELEGSDRSWSVSCSDDGCFVSGSSLSRRSSRVGVYLDVPAGAVSFYRGSSDSGTLIRTFNAAFREPLHASAELRPRSSALICQLT
ncbi:NACHT, LRR and PYD domains-containing protein 3-like [Pseudoliparis swirei]|uniref:NACHT, LRR and PYD domains-containing protein 3-like n=1 Tax=Pseudoliparis swirei TaxID=2059687 RepID=UPI0024BE146A|nr:NACHT, LRR and PYD domains-containing protein 3-like [Pseudoliparis swirei]XP_056299318.1 NACHT, LRR and PYD domains-containing protein 3-like [Pseudoliparis swirei]XP_056299320.1 NACHT, LRR and PYD domains-containing protein 3-like [Pseudoliparis swirei]